MAVAELGRTHPSQTGWPARMIRSPAVLATAGFFLIFIGLMSGHLYSFDGLLYFRGAEALVLDRSLVFDPPVIWGGPISRSIMPIGFSIVQMPAVLLAESAGSLRPPPTSALYDPALLYGDPVATLASWVNPLLVALTGTLIIHTAERLGAPRRASVLVAVAVIFGSPLVFYARADFAQPLTALLLVGIVALVIEAIQWRSIAPGLATGAVALSILTRPVDGLIVAFAVLLVLCLPIRGCPPIRERRRLGVEVVAGVLTGIAATMAVNAIRFGAPLDFGFQNEPSGSLPIGLIAEILSPGRGILWYFPLVILAPIGAWTLWRRGFRNETATVTLLVLIYPLVYATWQSLGQWSWGPRYLVPLIPLLGLPAAAVAWPAPRRAALLVFGGLALAGGLANLAHLAVDQLPFWAVYGDSDFGTPGFWRQFEPGAFAPIGSWQMYVPAAGPDIMWLRLAGSTHGASLFVLMILLALGVLALAQAWRLSSSARIRSDATAS